MGDMRKKADAMDYRISVRLPASLLGELEQRSLERQRSVAQLVRFAIREMLQRKDGAK